MKFEEMDDSDWTEWMTETEDGKRFMEICDEYEKIRENGSNETWKEFLLKKIQRQITKEKVREIQREKNGR